MHDHRPATQWIASHLGPGAVASGEERALRRLGYRLEAGSKLPSEGSPEKRPRLHLVDDRRMEAIPSSKSDPRTPIILLTGARPRANTDARIAGQLMRPVRADDLYRLLEHALEVEPRQAPRIRTRLSARYLRRNESTHSYIDSLSTSGCRLKTRRPLEVDRIETLRIAIPTYGLIETRARCVWTEACVAGFEFISLDPASRSAVTRYVSQQLDLGHGEARTPRAPCAA